MGKWKRMLSLTMAACLCSSLLTVNRLTFQERSTTTAHALAAYDDDLVLRYDSMAGYSSKDNAWDNGESFYRALPLGNGRIGAMVYGNCPDEWIDLNECTVWSAGPGSNDRVGAADSLSRVQAMLAAGDYTGANDIIGRNMIGGGQAKYQKVGMLKLSFGHENVTGYKRQLDMNNAVASTTYSCGGKNYRRETFVSHPDQVMVTRITCDAAGGVSLRAGYDGVLNGTVATDGTDTLVANGHGDRDLGLNGAVYFSSRSKFLNTGGTVSAGNGTVTVSGADSLVILTSVRTNFIDAQTCNGDEKGDAAKDIANAEKIDFSTLYDNHTTDFGALFKRVDVDLGGDSSVSNSKTMETRISEFGKTNDPKMVEALFQYGRYLMISASRDAQAMNLQGIWNKYSAPAWGSKSTTNINYEMNYWPAFTTNLAECFAPFVEKAKALQKTGNATAKTHYGISEGWVLHHNTDLWNRTGPIDGTWGQWPVGGAWVSNMLYDAYNFNQDLDYLKDVYPVIEGSAAFLNALMQPMEIDGQTYMVVSPSASPELGLPGYPWDSNVYCAYGVTMDNAICRELFKGVSSASALLGKNPTLRGQLQEKLSLIKPPTVGKWGQIQEWAYDWDNKNETHRHISHLYDLYPGFEISPATNVETAAAAATALNSRGDAGTGWSEAWKLNCWARLEDAAHAYNLIRLLITPVNGNESGRLYANLWDAHPPFQIDGNFGFTAGVTEMLLQSQNDEVSLLPALPKEWATGHANGLCARGAFEITEMNWADGKLTEVTILSNAGNPCTLRYGDRRISFPTEQGETYHLNGALQFAEATDTLTNVALRKTATASGEESGETAANALDGSTKTKWCDMGGLSDEWLTVDLGDVYSISRWSAKFAGVTEEMKYNARDFKLQKSPDGKTWTDVDTVYGNTESIVSRTVTDFTARYVRLYLMTATQDTSGGARVYDFEVWGKTDSSKPRSAYAQMEAETHDFMNGDIQTEANETGGQNIGYIEDGSYVMFRNVDFEAGAVGFRASAASDTEGGTIEIRIGSPTGKLAGTCEIGNTDGWQAYQTVECAVENCTGTQDVYLLFKGEEGYLLNLDWVAFYGMRGDLNGDRKVNGLDLSRCKLHLLEKGTLTGLALSNADFNGDGIITRMDANQLQAFLLQTK